MSGESVTEVARGYVGGKPIRKVSLKSVVYDISITDMIWRWDSICIGIKKQYGNKFSVYQVKVLLVLSELLNISTTDVSLSYQAICVSGFLRGMTWQDVVRSLDLLHGFGMIVEFGVTKGGKHHKYHLSEKGEGLIYWINSEMGEPIDILSVNSKTYHNPVASRSSVA